MADLQAEQLNDSFFKNFISETLYLIDEDVALPTVSKDKADNPAPVSANNIKPETTQAPQPVKPAAASPVLPKIPKIKKPEPSGKYKVIGKNDKGVIVLVTIPEDKFQALPKLAFLQKILSAIGLQTDDVAYLNNVSGATAKFEDMQQEMKVNYIISFASRLDTDLPHDKFTLYKPVTVGNVPVVFSQSLDMLENDIEHKRNLWNALQAVFVK